MSVQTFNPTDLSQNATNWAVAQRIVGPFAPHAQVSPDLTIALDPGHLLNNAILTEVNAQIVGPFTPPASGFRIDRVVVDRMTGAASIVTGIVNSLAPPAIPSGKLPVARVFMDNITTSVKNDAIADERALHDSSASIAAVCRAYLNVTTSVPQAVHVKTPLSAVTFDVGNGFDSANSRFKPSLAGYYAVSATIGYQGVSAGYGMSAVIYLNGATLSGTNSNTTGAQWVSTYDVVYLNGSTDFLEVYAYQSGPTTCTLHTGASNTYFTATKVA